MKSTPSSPGRPVIHETTTPSRPATLMRLAAWILPALLLAACTANPPARRAEQPGSVKELPSIDDVKAKAKAAEWVQIEKYNGEKHWIAHVEFDDFGTLADHKQMKALEDEVLNHDTAGTFKNGITLVAFMHGWQNNSDTYNANLRDFRETLKKLAVEESKAGRGVLGVYLGWRGALTPVPGLNFFTFWSRKSTAHSIGEGNLPEVLVRLKTLNYSLAERSPRGFTSYYAQTRFILVGHSFGAAALYSALSGPLKTDFIEAYTRARQAPGEPKPAMAPVTGFGDMVLLINPAFEALRYRNIDYHIRANKEVNYAPQQNVLMVIAASEGDWATGNLFPLGQTTGNLSRLVTGRRGESRFDKASTQKQEDPNKKETTSNQKQGRQLISSVGHWEGFYTHYLVPGENGEKPVLNAVAAKDPRKEITKFLSSPNPTSSKAGLTPFMLMRVDKELISDHSDIWRTSFSDFIVEFTTSQLRSTANNRTKVAEAQKLQAQKASR